MRTAVYCKEKSGKLYTTQTKNIRGQNTTERKYSYVANPHVLSSTNAIIQYNKMTIHDYMNKIENKIENSKFHILCYNNSYLLLGIRDVLGKGMKFFVQPRDISKEQRTEEKEKFKRDVRLEYFFLTI